MLKISFVNTSVLSRALFHVYSHRTTQPSKERSQALRGWLVCGTLALGVAGPPKRTGIMGLQPAGLHESSTLDEELKIKYSDMHTSSGFHFIFTFIQTSL